MSTTTTSASCLSATPRATVAPTFPAPPTTVTLRFIRTLLVNDDQRGNRGTRREDLALRVLRVLRCTSSHVLDDIVAKFRGLQLRRTIHQAREVVRHTLGGDRAFH